jgi:prepilin peptidase CpaA
LIGFGVVAHAFIGGWAACAQSLGLAVATILAGSFLYARGWLAGGDIKLIAAGAAVFGTSATLDFLFFTALAGGVLAATVAVRQRRLVATLQQMTCSLVVPGMRLQASTEHGFIPYGLAIAAGGAAVTLTRCFTGLRLPL